MVCIEVARGAPEFGGNGGFQQQLNLIFDSVHEYHQLFAQFGGTGGLSVCAGQQGDVPPFFGQQPDLAVEVEQGGHIFEFKGVFPKQGDCRVVDIL